MKGTLYFVPEITVGDRDRKKFESDPVFPGGSQVYIGVVQNHSWSLDPDMRLAILDDYQNVALTMADWDGLRPGVEIQTFHDTLASEDAVAERLRDFEIVVAMRERTAFRRKLLERLPKLKLLVTTGMVNASIDKQAAAERGIIVTGTSSLQHPTAELTWGLILALARNI